MTKAVCASMAARPDERRSTLTSEKRSSPTTERSQLNRLLAGTVSSTPR
ncbi:hypothetical protein [Leifsonia aquatica]